jgi:hypothetical protein
MCKENLMPEPADQGQLSIILLMFQESGGKEHAEWMKAHPSFILRFIRTSPEKQPLVAFKF